MMSASFANSEDCTVKWPIRSQRRPRNPRIALKPAIIGGGQRPASDETADTPNRLPVEILGLGLSGAGAEEHDHAQSQQSGHAEKKCGSSDSHWRSPRGLHFQTERDKAEWTWPPFAGLRVGGRRWVRPYRHRP